MTVAELIEAAKSVDPAHEVLIEGCSLGTLYIDAEYECLNFTGMTVQELEDVADMSTKQILHQENDEEWESEE